MHPSTLPALGEPHEPIALPSEPVAEDPANLSERVSGYRHANASRRIATITEDRNDAQALLAADHGQAEDVLFCLDEALSALGPAVALTERAIGLELKQGSPRPSKCHQGDLKHGRVSYTARGWVDSRQPRIFMKCNMKTHALFAAVLLSVYAFGLPLDAAALTLTRGPYLQLGTQSSIVVRWRTETATNSRVRYGTNPSDLSSVVDDSTIATEHVVKLTGLNPSTKYYYSVGHSEATLAGGTDHFFVAAPTPGTEQPTNIWVLGNSGIASAQARAVRDAYLKYKGNQYTHLWLMLGDNAYHNRTDSDRQDTLFNTYPTLLRQTTLWPALGHRDHGVTADSASQSGAYYDIFTLPKQGEAGGLASGTEAYYSFDYSNIHFVVLDSVESSKAHSGAMLTWLENDLAVTTQPWIIAYWDHPPCSKGSHDSETEIALCKMRENVLPILEDASVDLVLNGDCGSYERSFLMEGHSGSSVIFEPQTMLVNGGDGSIDGDGEYQTSVIDRPIRDAVVGSSGETQVGSLDYPVIYVSLKTLGSMALNVNGPLLDAVFLDDTGQVRDRFRMVKTTDTAKASTSAPDVPTMEVNPTPQTLTVSPTGGTVDDTAGNISLRSSNTRATTQGLSSTSNLVAHWTLDTQNVDASQSSAEVRDVSGYNNHADLKNHSATTVPGKLGQALSLDGVDDYAEKIAFSGLPSSAITVSAWIKLDAHKNWNRVLNHEWVNNGWLLYTDASGTAIFGVGQSGAQYNAIKSGLTVGSWYHLVGVYDGSNVRIYVNGQEGTPRAKSGLILDSGGNVDIGGAQGDRFKGAIDDVRIYDKALTASDVAALYNLEGTSNLVAHWTLDTQNVDASRSSAEVRDVSGYNNHADLKNHPATTAPGKLGQALSLDGVDDYAEKIAFSGLPSSAITVSAWIKLDAHKNWNRVLNHEWVNNGWLLFTDASGTATFGVGQSGAQYNAIKAGLTVGSWYHLVGVYDGSNVRVYVNGQEGTPRAKSGLILDSGGDVDIGGAERDRFKGAIDDVRIYNKVLTASEVQALYNVGETTDTSPPSSPTNLTANAVSSSQINLSWNASTDNVGVTGYKVYRESVQTATTTGTSYSNTGLSPSITYSYTVAAYDAAGNTSAQSTGVSATTQAAPDTTAPSAPTNLTAGAVSSSQINLAWTSSTDNVGVTGYKVYRGGTQITTVSGSSYQNTGLAPSTNYTYTVAAYDAAGNTSAQASSASATTQGALPTTTLSITSYGATGNDTTDDTTAIENTIAAAQSQRKGVYVPPGTFRYTSFRLNGIALTGNGATSILYAPIQARSMIILNGNGPILANLKVQTNGTSRTGADHNIFVEAATNFTIDNVEVTGSASAAILTYGSSGPGKIINNYVHDTFSDGIHNTDSAHDIVVANNLVRNTGDDCIAAVSYSPTRIVKNILIQDNDVGNQTAAGRGISSIGSSDITIQGNTIGQTYGAGVMIATEPSYTSPPLSNVLVKNNSMSNNATTLGGHSALMISALNGNIDRVRLELNTIVQPVNNAIKLEGTHSNTAIISNTMTDTQGAGITISGGTNVVCSGNTMNASATTHPKCTGVNNFTVTGSSLTYIKN